MGEPKIPDFTAFALEMLGVLAERNARYGTKNIRGPADVVSRLHDKVGRLDYAVARSEPASDDWLDVAGHAAIGWLLEKGRWDDRGSLRRVYFAHAIGDDAPDTEQTDAMVRLLNSHGFAVYWPRGAFHAARGHANWIWEVNLRAIQECDMLLAFAPYGLTPGVSAEMLYAKTLSKTVWCHASRESSLAQWASSRLFESLSDLVQAIKEVRPIEGEDNRAVAIPAHPPAEGAAGDDRMGSGQGHEGLPGDSETMGEGPSYPEPLAPIGTE